MKQTFLKSISALDLEFNKLLYPTRYQVVLKRPGLNPVIIFINKIEDDWEVADRNVPDFNEIEPLLPEILEAVYNNETIGLTA